jgi:hypothetical protein
MVSVVTNTHAAGSLSRQRVYQLVLVGFDGGAEVSGERDHLRLAAFGTDILCGHRATSVSGARRYGPVWRLFNEAADGARTHHLLHGKQ